MMDVTQALQRRNGFDCVMRLRASSGESCDSHVMGMCELFDNHVTDVMIPGFVMVMYIVFSIG